MAGNFCGVLIFAVHSPVMKIPSNTCTTLCAEGRPTGGMAKTSWQCDLQPFRVTKCLFVATVIHCHPVDGAFDSRDTIIHAIGAAPCSSRVGCSHKI